jgi:spore germination cell wall hydrolase CwlJ-like protein
MDELARTMWGEDRSGGTEGLSAVGHVIMNRCAIAKAYRDRTGRPRHPLFGDGTTASACLAHAQFDCWLPNDPNRAKLLAVTAADPQYADALQIAEWLIKGPLSDPTGGATYYFAVGSKRPSWADKFTHTCTIQGQEYYRV